MTWTDPRNWVASELVDDTIMNAHVRDNLDHLYDNLPLRATMFHYNSKVTNGNPLTVAILNTQPHNFTYWQSAAADADAFTQSFPLANGSYTMFVLGQTRTSGGKIDWDLDGTGIATGQDWYSGANTADVTKSVGSITVAATDGGRHVLTGTVNGKNASSSAFQIRLTAIWFVPSADS